MVHHIKHERLHPRSSLPGVIDTRPAEDDALGLVAGGWYAASLAPYQEFFGEQLMIFLHDDIREDPRGVYEIALGHVGAATDFVPPELDELVYSNQQGESAQWKRDISQRDREAVYRHFRDDLQELEQMLGRELSIWKPSR
jgi:hypothetical protein